MTHGAISKRAPPPVAWSSSAPTMTRAACTPCAGWAHEAELQFSGKYELKYGYAS